MAFSLNSTSRNTTNNHSSPSVTQISPKKRNHSSSLHCSSAVNDVFQAKCTKEFNKLRFNCRKTLQQDLTRLLDEEAFADTFIEGDTFRKPCHSCLLASRVPLFYSHLVNYFDSTLGKHAKKGFSSYRLPPSIDCLEITDFIKKVYCHEDISLEESLIIDKIRLHISNNMTSESGIDKKSVSSSGNDDQLLTNGLIKEDSLEDFQRAVNIDFDKDSLKPSDSLELVTDSLNNVSLSSEESKNDRQSSDYDDSLVVGQKGANEDDLGGVTSSGSSQMVRSGTFDMLSSIPLEDHSKKEDEIENVRTPLIPDEESAQGEVVAGYRVPSAASLKHRVDSLELDLNQERANSTKDSLEDEEVTTDGDGATPIAETLDHLASHSQSSSLFQFFVDMDTMSASMPECKSNTKEDISNMTSSGFMFIDLNTVGTSEEPKSRTLERDKNKVNDRSGTQTCPKKVSGVGKSSSSSSMVTRNRCKSSQSEESETRKHISNNVSSGKAMNYRRQASCPSSQEVRPSRDRTSLSVQQRSRSTRKGSPMSSMDSGMLSSVNSENPHGDDEEWLLSLKGDRVRINKPSTLWLDETLPEHSNDSACSSDRRQLSRSHRSKHRQYQMSSENSPGLQADNNEAEDDFSAKREELKRKINSCSKLGEDLLQMYLNGINSDVTIKADNCTIKAHRCILIARSPYFSAMFSGEWRDSKTSNITLQGFSQPSVHFALCHIYSGALIIPNDDSINLAELALLSNLLALDTLRDVVVYELEKSYCHFFHKPCSECIVGIVDCLIVSSECGFSTLHQKCLIWCGKHFARLWPTRSFACLPSSLLNSCFQSTIHSMTPKSIIEITLNCDRLTKTTPKVKWAEPIFALIGRLLEQCVNYVAGNYDLVLASDSFISLGRGNSWNISAIEETFIAAMNNLSPETACKTLVKLDQIISFAENEEAFGYGPYAEPYVALVRKMYRHCERSLVQNVNQAVLSPSWTLIPLETQKKIKDSAIIVFEFEKPLAPRPQLSSSALQSLRKKRSSESSESRTAKSSSTKNSGSHRSRMRSNERRKQMSLNRPSSDHIYDEVTPEPGDITSGASSLPIGSFDNDNQSNRHSSLSRRQAKDFSNSLSRSVNETREDKMAKSIDSNRSSKSPQSTPSRSQAVGHRPTSRTSRTSSSRPLATRPPFK